MVKIIKGGPLNGMIDGGTLEDFGKGYYPPASKDRILFTEHHEGPEPPQDPRNENLPQQKPRFFS